MSKYHQNFYKIKNKHKYIGSGEPYYRSGWELRVMMLFDKHPNILAWASEPFKIPYYNPFTGKNTVYVPDFFINYVDSNGVDRKELIEIKPLKDITTDKTLTERKKVTQKDKMTVMLNRLKWEAAIQFCKKAGITFRVLTEHDIFR